jgi:hypothetical protein
VVVDESMVYPTGMGVNYTKIRDLIQSLADNVAMESDTVVRLHTVVAMDREWRAIMVPVRDEAAYDARRIYARADLQQMTGYSNNQIAYWANRHRARTGAPPLPPRSRIDLSGAIDLTGAGHRPVVSE